MTIRSIHADGACAGTMAKLDRSITVAKSGDATRLYNLPRSIDAIDQATEEQNVRGLLGRIFNRARR